MVDLSLRERLQPSLFDRLIDDERLLTIYELTFDRAGLQRLGLQVDDLVAVISAQGLSPAMADGDAVSPGTGPQILGLRFKAPHGRVGSSQLAALVLKPPGASSGLALEALCDIKTHHVRNTMAESAERRFAAGRRLREYVSRDLSILLNAASLETSQDLSAVPHVQRSVLNFGMPSATGKSATSLDLNRMTRSIEAAIRQFEPRLSKVRVSPELGGEHQDAQEICLRVDAQLWGQPTPLQVVLRTRIDTESGSVRVSDAGSR
jgi:type VI secretion system protein ImpF